VTAGVTTDTTASRRQPSLAPDTADAFPVQAADGPTLRAYALPAADDGLPALLWGHANGFAAGSYTPLLRMLGARFRVFAYDARGHGGSDVPPPPFPHTLHIDRYARDLDAVAGAVRARIGDAPLYFASHSFSGVAALRLGAVFGSAPWAGITVFEPPLTPTPDLPNNAIAISKSKGLSEMARRRRRRWPSPDAYAESLAGRSAYAAFRPDMLRAHCHATLQPTAEGDWELACPPEVEMATYATVLNFSTFHNLPNFPLPVHFVAGDPAPADGPPSWAALVQAEAAARVRKGRLTVLTGTGHMMPFERPEECRDIVFDMAGAR